MFHGGGERQRGLSLDFILDAGSERGSIEELGENGGRKKITDRRESSREK
jgi:hypothetical protein